MGPDRYRGQNERWSSPTRRGGYAERMGDWPYERDERAARRRIEDDEWDEDYRGAYGQGRSAGGAAYGRERRDETSWRESRAADRRRWPRSSSEEDDYAAPSDYGRAGLGQTRGGQYMGMTPGYERPYGETRHLGGVGEPFGEFSGYGSRPHYGGLGGYREIGGEPGYGRTTYGAGASGETAPVRYGAQDQDEISDPDYLEWRRNQMRTLDDDYRAWRNERQKKFSDEFEMFRKTRERDQSKSAKSETSQTGSTKLSS
jgi:hypothetical protein